MKPHLVTIALITLAGCGNPGIVKLSPDTYMLSRTDRGGVFGNASKMKAEVFQEANEFAERQGKVAIPISTNETPMRIGQLASIDYQFRVVDKNDPEAKRTSLSPRSNIVIEKTEKISADIHSNDEKPKDLYTELMKLDDLREKGIITEEEFNTQKRKLLGN